MGRRKGYRSYGYLRFSQEKLENYYWCLVRFWTSVCWHYNTERNRASMGFNINALTEVYRKHEQ